MGSTRILIQDIITDIVPHDEIEKAHQQDTLEWIRSGVDIFRVEKPDTPPKHLVSYFVLHDETTDKLLLVDHLKARLWLPTGGHVEPEEHPKTTVIREAEEELGITADFGTKFKDQPLFVTVTKTRGPGTHIDVSLWYVIKADSSQTLTFDRDEMNDIRWFTFDQILNTDSTLLDPHMHRFVRKMRTHSNYVEK